MLSREGGAVVGSTERGAEHSRQREQHKQRKLQQMILAELQRAGKFTVAEWREPGAGLAVRLQRP